MKLDSKDIRMLSCIEDMLSKMEYSVSEKDPKISYISIDDIDLVFEDGKYKTWKQKPKADPKNSQGEKPKDLSAVKAARIEKLKKDILFCLFITPPSHCRVKIFEGYFRGTRYTGIEVCVNPVLGISLSTYIPKSIDYLASLPRNELMEILTHGPWVEIS